MEFSPTLVPISIKVLISLELAIIAYFDIKTRKIKNVWPALNIVLFGLLLILFPEVYIFNFATFFVPLAFLISGFVFFKVGIMGAGDAKLLFSLFLLIPLAGHDKMLIAVVVATLLVGGGIFIFNVIRNLGTIYLAIKTRNIDLVKGTFGKKFPFAPVILISWIVFLWDGIKF